MLKRTPTVKPPLVRRTPTAMLVRLSVRPGRALTTAQAPSSSRCDRLLMPGLSGSLAGPSPTCASAHLHELVVLAITSRARRFDLARERRSTCRLATPLSSLLHAAR